MFYLFIFYFTKITAALQSVYLHETNMQCFRRRASMQAPSADIQRGFFLHIMYYLFDWRIGHPKEVVRVLLRAAQLHSHRRPRSTERPSYNQKRQLSYPSRRRERSGEIAQEREVSRSGQRPSGAGAGRGRSHRRRPTDCLQHDLAVRGVANAVDPISHHHPSEERHPTAMTELSYLQPHQPPEQRYVEELAEPTEATSEKDHRWGTSRLQTRAQHNRADLQP